MTPSYRDYLPPDPEGGPGKVDSPGAPRPGHGTVWVNHDGEGQWDASWQDEQRIQDSPLGTRAQAIAWARAVPARKRVIFSAEANDYVEL